MSAKKSNQPLRILLVEDDQNDVIAFQRALRKASIPYDVEACSRAEEALQHLQEKASSFDLIVSDYKLPGMTGLDLHYKLIEDNYDIPFVLMTGVGSEDLATKSLKYGIDEYVIKDPDKGFPNLLMIILPEVIRIHNERVNVRMEQRILKKAKEELEQKVQERTAELARVNEELVQDILERRRAEKIQIIMFEISQAASIASDLSDLIKIIHYKLAKLIDTSNFFVALYDKESGSYHFPYYVDEFDNIKGYNAQKLVGSMTDYVRRTGRPLFADEAKFLDLVERGEVELVGTPSPIWMGVPLKGPDGTVGVVVVQSYRDGSVYTQQDLELFTFISDTISLVINKKHTDLEVLRKSAILDAINRIFHEAMAKRTEESVVHYALSAMLQLTRSNRGFIGELDSDEALKIIAVGGFGKTIRSNKRSYRPSWECDLSAAHNLANLALKKKESWFINDSNYFSEFNKEGKEFLRFNRFLSVPIQSAGKIVGVIGLINKEENYDYSDQTAIETLAVASWEAINHKRAELALKRSKEELEERVEERTAELVEFTKQLLKEIEDREIAESALRTVFEQNEQLITSISSILIGINSQGCVTHWNSAAETSFGQLRDEAIGQSLSNIKINWDWEVVNRHLSECVIKNRPVKIREVRYRRPDQTDGFLNITLNPSRENDDGNINVLLLGEDVTELKVMESMLTQAQKLESIGQLAAGIAHEINTPTQYVGDNTRFLQSAFEDLQKLLAEYSRLLATIKEGEKLDQLTSTIEKIAREIDLTYLTEEIPKAIEQTLEGVERVSKIVRAMKNFAHPGSVKMTLSDLNRAIESTVTVSKNEWKYVAEMVTDFDPDLPMVPCLPDQFNQVILNMIVNAAHAIADVVGDGSKGKGTITISTRQKEDWVEISISDTGTGIPPEVQAKIFDPFFTTKAVGKGTGQGLNIAHDVIVEKHKGTITFDTKVGEGTTFKILLPLPPTLGSEQKEQMELADVS